MFIDSECFSDAFCKLSYQKPDPSLHHEFNSCKPTLLDLDGVYENKCKMKGV